MTDFFIVDAEYQAHSLAIGVLVTIIYQSFYLAYFATGSSGNVVQA